MKKLNNKYKKIVVLIILLSSSIPLLLNFANILNLDDSKEINVNRKNLKTQGEVQESDWYNYVIDFYNGSGFLREPFTLEQSEIMENITLTYILREQGKFIDSSRYDFSYWQRWWIQNVVRLLYKDLYVSGRYREGMNKVNDLALVTMNLMNLTYSIEQGEASYKELMHSATGLYPDSHLSPPDIYNDDKIKVTVKTYINDIFTSWYGTKLYAGVAEYKGPTTRPVVYHYFYYKHITHDIRGYGWKSKIVEDTSFEEYTGSMSGLFYCVYVEMWWADWLASGYKWRFWTQKYDDDDKIGPDFISVRSKFESESTYRVPEQPVYIFKDEGGNPIDEVDQNIKVALSFDDPEGINQYRYRYRLLNENIELYTSPNLYHSAGNEVLIPKNDQIIDSVNVKGWKSYVQSGLDTIELKCAAMDDDDDRTNDGTWSPMTSWKRIAKVIEPEILVDDFIIDYEYDPPTIGAYNPYKGEDVQFSVKFVNGFDRPVAIESISYAVISLDNPSDMIYYQFDMTNLNINPQTQTGTISPTSMTQPLLDTFQNDYGDYQVSIVVDCLLDAQPFQITYTDLFSVISPEQPLVNYYFGDVKLDTLAFDEALMMYYKDDINNQNNEVRWRISIENRARLTLRLTRNLEFDLSHSIGKNINKLEVDGNNNIQVQATPCTTTNYDFAISIKDPSVFGPQFSFPGELLQLWDVVNFFGDCYELRNALKGVESFNSMGGKVFKGLGNFLSVVNLFIDSYEFFYDIVNLDMYNMFNVDFSEGTPFGCDFYDNTVPIFEDLYLGFIKPSDISFDIFATLSTSQFNEVITAFILQAAIIGLDITSTVAAFYSFADPITGPIIAISTFITSLILKEQRNLAKQRCDDPPPPSGDYTEHVIREYDEVSLPYEIERFPRYSQIVYDALRAASNLKNEKNIQQEIRNRMNAAKEDDALDWTLFQMEDLTESIKLEENQFKDLIQAVNKLSDISLEDMTNMGITNQDFLFVENEVEANGLPSDVITMLNASELDLSELTNHVSNITEYDLFNEEDPDNQSYEDYFEHHIIEADLLRDIVENNYNNLEEGIANRYINYTLQLEEETPEQLTLEDIELLESLKDEISDMVDLKQWNAVIGLCDDLLVEINQMMIKILNTTDLALLSYKDFAESTKSEAIENNIKHLTVFSPAFNERMNIEPLMSQKVPIYLQLVDYSFSNVIGLEMRNLDGNYRFLDKFGNEITQITISPQSVFKIYLEFSFNIPDNYGDQILEVVFFDAENEHTYYRSISITLLEDNDETAPIILINYVDGDYTDGNPGTWDFFAYDRESGINPDSILVYIDGLLTGNSLGQYEVDNTLGSHSIEVEISNDDQSNPEYATASTSIIIDDDDSRAPEISLFYTGKGLDNDPGSFSWEITDLDDNIGGDHDTGFSNIDIRIFYVSSEGLPDQVFTPPPVNSGTWNLPPYIGTYTIVISATDNDNDRTLVIDSLTTEVEKAQDVIDDDVDPPELSDLEIEAGIFEINISLAVKDWSGIKVITIFINGEIIEPIKKIQDGDTYFFTVSNQWLFERGYSEVEVFVEDNDDDRPNDALISSISGSFKNVLYQMYEYVDWQLEEIQIFIEKNLSSKISGKIVKKLSQAQEELIEAFNLIENGTITCGLMKAYLAKTYISIAEHYTEIYNKRDQINDNKASYIIQSLHAIRNNIVYLKGASTGVKHGVDISYIEVELLNLFDFAAENIPSMSLIFAIRVAAEVLELSIIEISLDEDPQDLLELLDYAQYKLEHAIRKIDHLLRKERISQELANYMVNEISQHIEAIEMVKDSLNYNEPLPLGNAKTSKDLRNDSSEGYAYSTIAPKEHGYAIIFQQLIFLGISFILILQNLFPRLKKYNKY